MADTRSAVGTTSPIGGDYRGGEVRPASAEQPRWVRERLGTASGNTTRAAHRGLRVVAALGVVGVALAFPGHSSARGPVPPDVFKAVRAFWKTTPERVKAFDVIACETGDRYNTTARNGQYLGLFQMGSFARARYGHGSSAYAQARAAHRYYVDAGWSPWSCPVG